MNLPKSTEATFKPNMYLVSDMALFKNIRLVGFVIGVVICYVFFTNIGFWFGVGIVFACFIIRFPKGDKGVYVGKCPACESDVFTRKNVIGFDCQVCGSRLIYRDDRFFLFNKQHGFPTPEN